VAIDCYVDVPMRFVYLKDKPEFAQIASELLFEYWSEAMYDLGFETAEESAEFMKNEYVGRGDSIYSLILLLDEPEGTRGPEKLMGFAQLSDCDMSIRSQFSPWIATIMVLPEYRKNGVGKMLVEVAESLVGSLGCPELYLWTFPHLVKWYQDQGWSLVERVDYCGFDAHVMKKTLTTKTSPFVLPDVSQRLSSSP